MHFSLTEVSQTHISSVKAGTKFVHRDRIHFVHVLITSVPDLNQFLSQRTTLGYVDPESGHARREGGICEKNCLCHYIFSWTIVSGRGFPYSGTARPDSGLTRSLKILLINYITLLKGLWLQMKSLCNDIRIISNEPFEMIVNTLHLSIHINDI